MTPPLISSEKELTRNAAILEKAIWSNDNSTRKYARQLIKRGRCFYVIKGKFGLHFYPSRFIGYKGITVKIHEQSIRDLDGRITSKIIDKLLGPQIESDEIDSAFIAFCKKLEIEPNNHDRSFWLAENVQVFFKSHEERIIDDFSDNQNLKAALNKLQGYSSQFQKKVVEATIRKDTPIIKALKKKHKFKCQFPNCNSIIKKENGELYVEVAHIEPVSKKGISTVGNLLVLCPNHHKEFDYGKREIQSQNIKEIKGKLNGKEFHIFF